MENNEKLADYFRRVSRLVTQNIIYTLILQHLR